MEFNIKIWKFLGWQNRTLIMKDTGFQIKEQKNRQSQIYPLTNAILIDLSKNDIVQIFIKTKAYSLYLKSENPKEGKILIHKFEEIINKNSTKTAFSEEYQKYNQEISKFNEKDPYDKLICKLNVFQNLMIEMNRKLFFFKTLIHKNCPNVNSETFSDFMSVHNNLMIIKDEMKNQFDNIIASIYHFQDNKNNNHINIINEEEKNSETENNIIELTEYHFMSKNLKDFYDPFYNFEPRKKFPKKLKCPQNIVKEMLTTFTKKKAAPVYFNEPISLGQKQCEKFFYLDLLTKASIEKYKPKQLCYISAFIIGELFTMLKRNLKPFTPIIGETFEYINNKKNFRYYSEQICHKPNILGFIGETPDFGCYGDTKCDTNFKFMKGAFELDFKNKINIYFKKQNLHYIYNRPIILIKGIMKNKIYNDYIGTTIIKNVEDSNYKCEIEFHEENSENIGMFDGKVYENDKVIYLLGGNWNSEIYMMEPNNEKKTILLEIDKNQEYLKNDVDSYTLPDYCANLNFITEDLKKILPNNDTRFRKDITLLENQEIEEAQKYKEKYEEKQRKELDNNNHSVLFFDEELDLDSQETIYKPNGKYWEMRKQNKIKENLNNNIFYIEEH